MIRAIAGFILADDKDRIRPSDLTAGVRKLRNDSPKEIADLASRFCALGWLRPEDDKTPMPKAWLVAPGLREHFAERRKQVQQARAEAHAILSAGGGGALMSSDTSTAKRALSLRAVRRPGNPTSNLQK